MRGFDLLVTVPVKWREWRLVFVQKKSGNFRQGVEPLRLRAIEARFRFHGVLLHNLHGNVLA
jgi:hypothetical protein